LIVNEKSSMILAKDKEIRALESSLSSKTREVTEQALSLEDYKSIQLDNLNLNSLLT
jgi:hypothetical protein